jgi:hypothetical protein
MNKSLIVLIFLALTIAPAIASADPINETKAIYNPTILPDSPLYNIKISLENWMIDHQYLLLPDNNQTSISAKRVAFIQRRIIDTQRMMSGKVDIHAINNSISHMQIAIMKLNGSTNDEIKSFRNSLKIMTNKTTSPQLKSLFNKNRIELIKKQQQILSSDLNESVINLQNPQTFEVSQQLSNKIKSHQQELYDLENTMRTLNS